ncbi:autophagy protein 5 isoform X2 [Gossypium arboreum]|uniref:autophagy protein 5 isoform X2 n=1 Tax=Gossypium arboreum TaxID=29729 RepID=UPI0022F19673|nr:autophagy protein 5 isoform X2 [Gossypium arboreum]
MFFAHHIILWFLSFSAKTEPISSQPFLNAAAGVGGVAAAILKSGFNSGNGSTKVCMGRRNSSSNPSPRIPSHHSSSSSSCSGQLLSFSSLFLFFYIFFANSKPFQILAPRIGYLPLLAPLIKPYFSSTLPPGVDTIWFDCNGLPLKWYIPTGVLFDLLCPEPERPWNITVHFRGYPGNVLIPCEGEDSVKWSFINSLKEAAYIMNGNCKNVMNMSQSDQLELWHSVMNGNLEAYQRVSSKLKLATVDDEYASLCLQKSQQSVIETDLPAQAKTGRVPVRLYVLSVSKDFDDLDEIPRVDSWEKISYINRPVEIRKEDKCFTLHDALKILLPELFLDESLMNVKLGGVDLEDAVRNSNEDVTSVKVVEDQGQNVCKQPEACRISSSAKIKLIRIQGIEPKLEIPFSWVANNLLNPDYFLHVCVCVKVAQ